jgi:hypothetical protein
VMKSCIHQTEMILDEIGKWTWKLLHPKVTTGLRLFCSVAMRRTGRVLGAKTLEPLCSRQEISFFVRFRRICIPHGAGASG